MKRATLIASFLIPCSCLAPAFAGPVTGLTTFTSGTAAKASEVNGNFNAVKTAVDDNDSRITNVESDVESTQASLASQDARIVALESLPDPRELLAYGSSTADAVLTGASLSWSGSRVATYRNLTISAGTTLTVPTGVTFRCSGTFVNNGTIVIQTEARGGVIDGGTVSGFVPSMAAPDNGDTPGGTSFPAYDGDGTFSSTLAGGSGGQAPARATVVSNLTSLQSGGGGGSGSTAGLGGHGGGIVRIYASGSITNAGAIVADGGTGYGGGGGGLVALASNTSIVNSGSISARGGAGESASTVTGVSAGGGGGAVLFIAPSVTEGTVNVSGGSGGANASVSSTVTRSGGGGGGSGMGGAGGTGGSVTGMTSTDATVGVDGFSLTLDQDPLEVIVP